MLTLTGTTSTLEIMVGLVSHPSRVTLMMKAAAERLQAMHNSHSSLATPLLEDKYVSPWMEEASRYERSIFKNERKTWKRPIMRINSGIGKACQL